MMKKLFSILALVTGCITDLVMAQQVPQPSTLIVPAGLDNAFGDTSADPIITTRRAQQIYGSSMFAGASTDVIQITSLTFRANEQGSSSSLDVTIPSLTVYMGVFRGQISDIPGNNFVALDRPVIVLSAQDLHLVGQIGTAFDIRFSFDVPFIYDRTEGQLGLVIATPSTPYGVGLRSLDAQSASDGLFVYLESFDSVRSRPIALATQFSYVAVPEPSSIMIMIVALCAFSEVLQQSNHRWRAPARL